MVWRWIPRATCTSVTGATTESSNWRRADALSTDQPGDRAHRDRQPRRAVPGLVCGLVDGLVQLVGRQPRRRVARIGSRHRCVPVAERRLVAVHPFTRAGGQLLAVLVGVLVDQALIGRGL